MIIDFRDIDHGMLIETDLCIIGAGAAGITLAREFLGSSFDVCLAESGGINFDGDVQELYGGQNVGHPYYDLDISRLRYFGGSTNHWEGACAPLAPIDFRPRAWVPYSGWPVTREDTDPYYRRAQQICQLGEYAYGEEVWASLNVQPHRFDPAEVKLGFFQNSPPTRFGEFYRAELERAGNIRVLLHANVTNISAEPSASAVQKVDVRTLEGKTARIRARAYVLACGGIENARLLLLSDGAGVGLGNRHDLVGRFFMEHPHTTPGIIATDDRDRLFGTYRRRLHKDVQFWPSFCGGEAMQEREQVLNSHAFLYASDLTAGARAARQLWGTVKDGQVPSDLIAKLWLVVRDLDGVAQFAYRQFVTGRQSAASIEMLSFLLRSEQAPNPESRVTLADERDALGLRRARLDWRLTELDGRTIERMTRTLGIEFARLNIGRVQIADWLLSGDFSSGSEVEGGYHHMGTTRMAADPRQGVVDSDCRLHDVHNLYVAGSSVFPTGDLPTRH